MSGPLKNPRHERFVALLLQGESATDAHEHCGFSRDDGNAARLRQNPRVQARLAELQAEVAKDTKCTVESLLSELEEARAKAVSLDQMSAAVKSISEKARISGLMVEKKQIEIGGPGSFDHCNSTAEVVDDMFKYMLNPYHAVTDQDRENLIAMMNRHNDETNAFIEAIKARPYLITNPSPKRLTFGTGNGKARSEN
jgi:hypothetical protein